MNLTDINKYLSLIVRTHTDCRNFQVFFCIVQMLTKITNFDASSSSCLSGRPPKPVFECAVCGAKRPPGEWKTAAQKARNRRVHSYRSFFLSRPFFFSFPLCISYSNEPILCARLHAIGRRFRGRARPSWAPSLPLVKTVYTAVCRPSAVWTKTDSFRRQRPNGIELRRVVPCWFGPKWTNPPQYVNAIGSE